MDKEVKDGDLSFLFKDKRGEEHKASEGPNMKSLVPMVPSVPEGTINRVQIYSFTNRNGVSTFLFLCPYHVALVMSSN